MMVFFTRKQEFSLIQRFILVIHLEHQYKYFLYLPKPFYTYLHTFDRLNHQKMIPKFYTLQFLKNLHVSNIPKDLYFWNNLYHIKNKKNCFPKDFFIESKFQHNFQFSFNLILFLLCLFIIVILFLLKNFSLYLIYPAH